MDDELFKWIGVFAFPIAIIALLFAFSAEKDYSFNETQFTVNNTNISINESWILSTINTSDINFSINTNYSNYAGDSHLFDGYSVSGFVSYIQNLFDSVYCKLTGCTMAGDINMGGNNVTNIGNIYTKTEINTLVNTTTIQTGSFFSNSTCVVIGNQALISSC